MDDAHVSEPEFKYYYHDAISRVKTGLTIDEVVKYFENDLSVIVIDPFEKQFYRAGKPMEVEDNTKNAKTIEFKALK